MVHLKPSLIDSNAEMLTRRKATSHRERLSEKAPNTGDAIVRACGKTNRMKPAEMPGSSRKLFVKLPEGEAAFNHLLNNYVQNSRNKGISWELTREEFAALTKSRCFYCGNEPSRIWKGASPTKTNGHYIYNGVDRLNSGLNYTADNVVPCCGTCNLMKNTQSFEAFLRSCKAVVNHCLKSAE